MENLEVKVHELQGKINALAGSNEILAHNTSYNCGYMYAMNKRITTCAVAGVAGLVGSAIAIGMLVAICNKKKEESKE